MVTSQYWYWYYKYWHWCWRWWRWQAKQRGRGVRRVLLVAVARGSGGRQNGASRPRVWLGFSVRCVVPCRPSFSPASPFLSILLHSSLCHASPHRSRSFFLSRITMLFFLHSLDSFFFSFTQSLLLRKRLKHRRLDFESTIRSGS